MNVPAALDAPRASQRNATTTQAEPAFLAQPTTAGLKRLGQKFEVVDTSPLNPNIKIAPTIGTATALELFAGGSVQAVGEVSRRGGGAAGVVSATR
jgi:gamma-glutamyltranspeptidase / glutathione hydrolase